MTVKKRFYMVAVILVVILVGCLYGHLRTGFTDVSDTRLLNVLLGNGSEAENLTVFDFRMVRSVLALLIGMGLALSGAVFQTIARNELASPSLLGVNAGAGLGVVLLIYFTNGNNSLGIWTMPMVAIIGATAVASLIYRLSYRGGRILSTHTLVLTGISLSAGIHAIQTLLVVRLDPNKFYMVNTWVIGSISGNSWNHVAILAPIFIFLALVLYARHMDLNILSLSDETAIGLGIRINRARFIYLMIAVVLAACCVAIGGSIGFVGLISPHIARRLVGADHSYYLPVTALIGAILVVAADWFGRAIVAPDEILVGIVVSLIGAPYFLYILAKAKA